MADGPDFDSSTSSEGSHPENDDHVQPSGEEKIEIAKAEDKAVFYLRLLVLFVLIAAAVCVSLWVYFYLSNEEENEFHENFDSDASKVLEAIGTTLDNTLGPVDALIVNVLAFARATNQSFPFVTLPSYGLQAAKVLRVSKAIQVHMSFFVQEEQRQQWEEYAAAHTGDIDEALDVLESDPEWTGLVYRDYNVCPSIFTWGGVPVDKATEYSNTYLPNWHEYPPLSGATGSGACPMNYDHWRMEDVANALMYMNHTQQAVIGNFPAINLDASDPEQKFQKDALNKWVEMLVPPEIDPTEPLTQIAFPIFNSLDSVYIDTSKKQEYVGYVALSIQFRSLLLNTLPDNSNGVIVVVEQSCGVPFTYRLDGGTPTFLGVGDYHESKYDEMVHSQIWEEMVDTAKTGRVSSYTGVPISPDFCPNTVKIYPSTDMEDSHKTSNPAILAAVSALIFVFTSLVFITYDCLVSKRQKIVMSRALESGAIVSSLFPEEVRKQLYEENKQKFQKSDEARNTFKSQESNVTDSNQIAKLHPETTIFFADLAGFTAWSSKRQPKEVFELLEELYGAFDAIATRYNVFKVETIGDCYVAVTGLPDPQPNHAVLMVKFARACMSKMKTVTFSLADKLGEDTTTLEMRVGLHSGPVTAGVLRGKKSRFQLFGDSVNTASRMESNGIKGRMQCSQTTADALTAAGKGHWLTPRAEKVLAKGKGKMQTYWVNVTTRGPGTASSSGGTAEFADGTGSIDGEEGYDNDIFGKAEETIAQVHSLVSKPDVCLEEATEDESNWMLQSSRL